MGEELKIYALGNEWKIEEKGLQDVAVFQLTEDDAVAAYTLDEAIAWYQDYTGVEDDEIYEYDQIETIPFHHYFLEDENSENEITLKEIVKRYWEGEPFIALTRV